MFPVLWRAGVVQKLTREMSWRLDNDTAGYETSDPLIVSVYDVHSPLPRYLQIYYDSYHGPLRQQLRAHGK